MFPLVLWHFWLGDRKQIRLVETHTTYPIRFSFRPFGGRRPRGTGKPRPRFTSNMAMEMKVCRNCIFTGQMLLLVPSQRLKQKCMYLVVNILLLM